MLLVLAPLAISLVPYAPAYAADATWLDAAHIKIGNDVLIDGLLGDSGRSYTKNGQLGCTDEIKDFNGSPNSSSRAYFFPKHPDPTDTSNCIEDAYRPIEIGDVSRASVYFYRNPGDSSLTPAFQAYNFSLSGLAGIKKGQHDKIGGEVFEKSAEQDIFAQKNGDSCHSTVQTATGSETGRFTPRKNINTTIGVFNTTKCESNDTRTVLISNTPPEAGVNLAPAGGSSDTTCNIPYISWIVCPLITVGYGVIHFLETQINGLLKTPDLSSTEPVWAAFRNLANILFVLIFLIIIFSNMLSIHLDSYTVKKLLPKLVMAAILVQFSFVLSRAAIDISNIAGVGVAQIIPAVGKSQSNAGAEIVGITEGIALVGGGVGGAVLGVYLAPEIAIGVIITVLLLIISGLAAIFVVFFTLTVRLIAIQLFVIVAPIAFALWVLPNTEKYFKKWLENFIKLLIMYPLIRILFAAAELVNQVANNTGGNFASHLAGTIAPIAAFFMVPATIKIAEKALSIVGGSHIGKAGSFGSNLRKGAIMQNVKKGVQESASAKLLQNNKAGIVGFGARAFGKAVTGNSFAFGAPGKRKIAATAAAARGARFKDHTAGFEEEGYANSDLQRIAKAHLKGDKQYQHFNSDGTSEMRDLQAGQGEAAIAYMGSHGGDLEISKLLEEDVYNGAPVVYTADPKTGKMGWRFQLTDTQKAAKEKIDKGLILGGAKGTQAKPSPHLVKDAGAFGEGTNEGVIAGLKGPSGRTGARVAFSMDAAAAQKNLDSLFALTKNQDLAKDMDKDTALEYRRNAIAYLSDPTRRADRSINYVVEDSTGVRKDLLQHLQDSISAQGSINTDMSWRKV